MRKCRLGATLPKRSWSPQFRVSDPRGSRTTELGARNTGVMSYWPTPKSPNRQERLRHYWHIDMAHLLDAWPWVVSWTAERDTVPLGDGRAQFTPDFQITTRDRAYALRLVGGKESRPASKQCELREKCLEQGRELQFLAREEVCKHPHLPLARELFYFRNHDWPEDLPRRVSMVTECKHPATLGDLYQSLGEQNVTWEQLLSLVANGHIEIDLDDGLVPSAALLACRVQGYRQ